MNHVSQVMGTLFVSLNHAAVVHAVFIIFKYYSHFEKLIYQLFTLFNDICMAPYKLKQYHKLEQNMKRLLLVAIISQFSSI